MARDPEVAGYFARLAARPGNAGKASSGHDAGEAVYPLLHRTKKHGTIELAGDESDFEIY